MSDFLRYVFSYFRSAMTLILPALVLGGLCLAAAALVYKKKYGLDRKFPWGRVLLWLALAGYLAMVLYVTVFRLGHGTWRQANWHLFRAWREAWNNFSEKNWLNVFLNIGMFAPLGVLLPLLSRKLRAWPRALGMGFLTSLAIETVQYLLGRGLFDVDDLFCNTLGTMLGYWLVMAVLCALRKKPRGTLRYCAALLAAAAGACGIFVAYGIQEFGNLPEAPAFRVNTAEVEWTVSFEPGTEETVATVYRMTPPDREECAAFGTAFLKNAGAEAVDVTFYNEEVYLREKQGNRIMSVYYLDGTYVYMNWNDFDFMDAEYDAAEEETIRTQLSFFGITVPDGADFSVNEENWNCFTLDRHVEGETMTDGTLRCAYVEGDGIREIENHLRTFTRYGDVTVISEREALERIRAGWLTGGDWFERVKPGKIQILSCELAYRVDTKGFYQPVWLVALEAADAGYAETVLVPAVKG